jgi:pyruvate dehydrogenase E2 component (dihydrolipoamide acetyltransferase)
MAETVSMPKLGFDMAEGTLVRWVKAEGELVSKGEVLAEIETDKATVEVESGFTGLVAQQLVPQGSIVPVGTPIAIITQPGEEIIEAARPIAPETEIKTGPALAKRPDAKPQTVPEISEINETGSVVASPLARRMAADRNINLSLVKGSGPGGRIVKRDVEGFKAPASIPTTLAAAAVVSQTVKPTKIPVPVWTGGEPSQDDEVVVLDKLRTIIGRRMTESKQQVPHFYVTHEYDVAALLKLRKEVNAYLPDEQKLSVNDFIVKGVAMTLRQFPNINASLNGDKIIRHGQVNVGVAVALESGLITVVCKNADVKPVRLISTEIKEMVNNARQGKVKPEHIEGSTFSISNLGMFDVEHFVAIINPPEAAILAVGSAKEVPVVKDGEIKPGTRMKATISCDHRVTDGAEAARFMQVLAGYLETPIQLMS